jgi:TolB protein
MLFKIRRSLGAALAIYLLIQMHIANTGYAAPPAKIAFTSTRGGNFEIYTMDSNGANQLRLTDDPAYDVEPSWSPDGDRIAFVSAREKRGLNIHVMDSDGRNLMELTKESSNTEPAWSPDGTKIAFIRVKRGTHVWVMDADGGNQMQLTQLGSNYSPTWSPDGVRIAFVTRKRHGGPEIYVIDRNGNNEERLTHDLEKKGHPSWSPDGQWIAHESLHRGDGYQIFVVRTDGSGHRKQLTRKPPHKERPAWSPDGGWIAYVEVVPNKNTTIHLMTAEGIHLKQLSAGHAGDDNDPDWYALVGWSVPPAGNFVTIWGKIKKPTAGRR